MTSLTETEAKTKACFKAATFGGSQQLADGPGPNCIGSACMAWRETAARQLAPARSIEREGFSGETYVSKPAEGYCGLAGPVQ